MSLPIGTVVGLFGVKIDDKPSWPTGWLYCDGSQFDGQKYPTLASMFSNNTLPDLVGLALIGAGTSNDNYPPSTSVTSTRKNPDGTLSQNTDGTYGSLSHMMSCKEMPSHQHFSFGENIPDWPMGTCPGYKNVLGSKGEDSDNFYLGTTFNGGYGSSNQETPQPHQDPLPLMQPSFAIYFFVYAGESDSASQAQLEVENV